jgi:hypothetical protein
LLPDQSRGTEEATEAFEDCSSAVLFEKVSPRKTIPKVPKTLTRHLCTFWCLFLSLCAFRLNNRIFWEEEISGSLNKPKTVLIALKEKNWMPF